MDMKLNKNQKYGIFVQNPSWAWDYHLKKKKKKKHQGSNIS